MSLLLFVCLLLVGVISFVTALALWLSQLVGSITLAWLIVGVVLLVIALVIYFVSLHATIMRINRRLDTVYEVSATVEGIFHNVALYIKKIADNLFKV